MALQSPAGMVLKYTGTATQDTGRKRFVLMLFDGGSERRFITEEFARILKATGLEEELSLDSEIFSPLRNLVRQLE